MNHVKAFFVKEFGKKIYSQILIICYVSSFSQI